MLILTYIADTLADTDDTDDDTDDDAATDDTMLLLLSVP